MSQTIKENEFASDKNFIVKSLLFFFLFFFFFFSSCFSYFPSQDITKFQVSIRSCLCFGLFVFC